jgi:hypothetical protein
MELPEQMKVEVRTSEEGFQGGWFEGVILDINTYGQHCTCASISYQDLLFVQSVA